MAEDLKSSYDDVAEMYHQLWANWYFPAALPALERLFFSQVPAGSAILELCCGSGHVTRELVDRQYRVTGVDNSAALLALARQDLPAVEFLLQDVRKLKLKATYPAALCTFDSLNHVLELEELQEVFAGVEAALEPGGLFVFDMNLEEAYQADLHQWVVDVQDDRVGLVRGTFDPLRKRAATELIWFVRSADDQGAWRQRRSTVEHRCYRQEEILRALHGAGYVEIESASAAEAGITAELGYGRVFFAARSGVRKNANVDSLG